MRYFFSQCFAHHMIEGIWFAPDSNYNLAYIPIWIVQIRQSYSIARTSRDSVVFPCSFNYLLTYSIAKTSRK